MKCGFRVPTVPGAVDSPSGYEVYDTDRPSDKYLIGCRSSSGQSDGHPKETVPNRSLFWFHLTAVGSTPEDTLVEAVLSTLRVE